MTDFVARPDQDRETHCTGVQYAAMYERSIADPDGFWLEQADRLDWETKPTKGGDWSFDPVDIKWFADGKLNLCHNAVDRHLATRGDDTAIIFEPDDPAGEGRKLTYRQLHAEVVQMANALESDRRDQWRAGHDLHAQYCRRRDRDARLRKAGRDPFGGVRRLFSRRAGGPDRRLRKPIRHHRRRRSARHQERAA